jgi:hypothetical protein
LGQLERRLEAQAGTVHERGNWPAAQARRACHRSGAEHHSEGELRRQAVDEAVAEATGEVSNTDMDALLALLCCLPFVRCALHCAEQGMSCAVMWCADWYLLSSDFWLSLLIGCTV